MKNLYLLLTLFCVFPFLVQAQTISGKITNGKNIPITDANLVHHTTQNHTHTDKNGQFSLSNVSIGDSIYVSHIGYDTKVVVVSDDNKPVEIVLNESFFELDEIVIGRTAKSINVISTIDMTTNPVNSSQEILRKVPGLIIGQHAGGGKAEQIFLRGFDIDHGTDVAITVDGMPVNMVSHAHGQGYADLHFLIPETVDKIDFGKGPYYADKGNFATAGYVGFQTKDRLDNSAVQIESGLFNTNRALAMLNLLDTEDQSAYIASEYILTDGPVESSQNFNRFNIMGKYTATLPNQDKISVLASHFTSKWDASGQIPQRKVDDGTITRFGAIDDTEGGFTSRTNVALSHNKVLNNNTFIKNRIYYSHYDFELYSNFTFFLNDPINGDQIRQKENRNIVGLESVWNKSFVGENLFTNLQIGGGLRYDQIEDNELSRSLNRIETLSNMKLGDINESNLYTFINAEFDYGKWLINPALRLDYFKFDYVDALSAKYATLSDQQAIASPKLNIIYNHTNQLQGYLKLGMGFHANDTRVNVIQQTKETLPAAYGADLGVIWKPAPRLVINTALWYLFLEQEFVYVGDEGVVEPSGRTQRQGLDLGIRYQLTNWLYLDADANYAHARSVDDPEGENYIPLAPAFTATGGLSVQYLAWKGSWRSRFVDDRPANEDNSIIAAGYWINDVNINYRYKQMEFGVVIENLFDVEWKETQFATESRLFDELESVEEIHFTPGTPFFIKGTVRYIF